MQEKVLKTLKPKVVALGFSEEELNEISSNIASGLNEEATEEEINAMISGVIPILKVSQKAVNRIVNAKQPKPVDQQKAGQEEPEKSPQKEDLSALIANAVRSAINPLADEITAMKAEKIQQKNMVTVREKCKHMDPEFFEAAIDGRNFDTQDQVDSFCVSLEKRWNTYSQKLANEGLSRLSKPAGGQETPPDPNKPSPEVAARIKRREAEKAAPAVKGLPA
jgi:hypothetical protein